MQQAASHTDGITVTLDGDQADMFRAALLGDIRDRAKNLVAVLDTALDTSPAGDAREDVTATLALIAESVDMLERLGWS